MQTPPHSSKIIAIAPKSDEFLQPISLFAISFFFFLGEVKNRSRVFCLTHCIPASIKAIYQNFKTPTTPLISSCSRFLIPDVKLCVDSVVFTSHAFIYIFRLCTRSTHCAVWQINLFSCSCRLFIHLKLSYLLLLHSIPCRLGAGLKEISEKSWSGITAGKFTSCLLMFSWRWRGRGQQGEIIDSNDHFRHVYVDMSRQRYPRVLERNIGGEGRVRGREMIPYNDTSGSLTEVRRLKLMVIISFPWLSLFALFKCSNESANTFWRDRVVDFSCTMKIQLYRTHYHRM